MQPREAAWSGQADTADAARARLASALRRSGHAVSDAVQDAFAQVPRHVFVPEVGAAAAYRDEAFVIKCDGDGLPVSSSSQPAMMAIMLDQLGLGPGDRVLEIGTGSGYNAAVMSAVVGSAGRVCSVDIDAELVARARASLTAAGCDSVSVRCADGGYGDPEGAPFDRIIVTAGAWDIAPAWLDQLAPGGRLVLPLSVRGIQLSVALQQARAGSASRPGAAVSSGCSVRSPDLKRCCGSAARTPLLAQMSDGAVVDGAALQRALAGRPADEDVLTDPVSLAELGDLDLWLTLASTDLDRIALLAAPGGWLSLAALLPFGGLVSHGADADRIGVAVLLPADLAAGRPAGYAGAAVTVRTFGPGGAELAASLAERVRDWAGLGGPGVPEFRLAAWPRGVPDPAPEAAGYMRLLRWPSVTISAGWPGPAGPV